MQQADRDRLRRLGARKAEIAALPVQAERRELWRRLNDRERSIPLVLINQIPWYEMQDVPELIPQCRDPFLRTVEEHLLRELYQWDHIQGDMIVEPVIYANLVIERGGFGIVADEDTITQGETGGIQSHHYLPQIRGPEDIGKLRPATVRHDETESHRRQELLQAVFDGLLPVVPRGLPGIWFAPWDQLVTWTGVTEILMDMVLRPDYVHALVDRYDELLCDMLDQCEQLGLLSSNNTSITVGSGGYGYTRDLPPADARPVGRRPREMWTGSAPQIFAAVSPEMHDEFVLRHDKRWTDRFGLMYYGCCEPYHNKIELLRARLPHLRKISCSPTCDAHRMAGQIGRDYVMSLKPNPAFLAEDRFRPEVVRADLDRRLGEAAGCNIEIILKDISTVRSDPRRLWQWAEIAVNAARGAGERG